MAAFTVVGTSSINTAASTDPQSWTVPVPSGTEVGDLLVLGYPGGGGYAITDARLTPVAMEGFPSIVTGAFGEATDFSDLTFDTTGMHPGLATVIAVRVTSGSPAPEAHARIEADYGLEMFGEQAGYVAAVAIVCDIDDGAGVEVGTDAAWTDHGEVSAAHPSGYASLRCLTYTAGDPVPSLTLAEPGYFGGSRNSIWLLWPTPVRRPYLRQRQSPRANPRISLHRPQLRQRQRFI